MNKSTFGFLAATALIFTPVAAFAQDNQQNVQVNHSAAAAVGTGNFVNQQTLQHNIQTQFDLNGYSGYGQPSSQISIQDNGHAASAVGTGNIIHQGTVQGNHQLNGNVDLYPVYTPVQY